MPYKDKEKQHKAVKLASKKYRERSVFTLKQIKQAFWAQFHKSGERWFNYLGTEEENTASTDEIWQQFVDDLREAKN